jgi:methanethiol S-methyltransferase
MIETPSVVQASARPFVTQSVYRFVRYPVSLSVLGLVWFVPVMTLDRAVFIGVWNASVHVGSVLKDRRLLFCVGDEYRKYEVDVPLGAALTARQF